MASQSKTLEFKIITPTREVLSEQITEVTMNTLDGEITVLPDHESLIGVIEPGETCIKTEKGELCLLAVAQGFFEIDKNIIRVFVDAADRAEELDEAAILAAKVEAEKALQEQKREKTIDRVKLTEAEARLKRELVKLQVLKHYRGKK